MINNPVREEQQVILTLQHYLIIVIEQFQTPFYPPFTWKFNNIKVFVSLTTCLGQHRVCLTMSLMSVFFLRSSNIDRKLSPYFKKLPLIFLNIYLDDRF